MLFTSGQALGYFVLPLDRVTCIETISVIHCLFWGNNQSRAPESGPLDVRQATIIQKLLVWQGQGMNYTPEGKERWNIAGGERNNDIDSLEAQKVGGIS